MKKILFAVDGTNFSNGAFEFVRRLNEISPVLVTGIFVPQLEYANLWSYATVTGDGAVFVPLLEEEAGEEVAKNIEQFEHLCQQNDIAYRVHKDFFNFALPVLKTESRFADVLILSGELFYKQFLGSNQFEYMKTAVHDAECPVLIVPEKGLFPTNNILAYDGSDDAVFAIKQFAYIFPELASLPTMLVHVEEEGEEIPSKDEIIELATQHYKDLTLHRLNIDPKKYFATWIENRQSSMLVSGSFSRSLFSQAFKKSFVAEVIEDHQLPVFIAHK